MNRSFNATLYFYDMRTILLLLSIAITSSIMAQNKVRFVEAGPQFTYHYSVDLGMSPLRYQGPSGGMWLGNYKYKNQVTEIFRLQGQYGTAAPSNKASSANRLHVQFDYHLLVDMPSWGTAKRQVRVGGSWLTLGGMRQHLGYANNNFNFEIATGPAASIQSAWGLHFFKRDWWLQGSLHIPIVAATQRPAYAYGGPAGFYNEEDGYFRQLLNSTTLASWGSYQRVLTQWALQYPLKNGNRVGLVYQWDLYRFSNVPQNPVTVGNHTLSLVTYFNY